MFFKFHARLPSMQTWGLLKAGKGKGADGMSTLESGFCTAIRLQILVLVLASHASLY